MTTGMIRLRELTVRYAVKTGVDGAPVRIDRVVSAPRECANVLRTLLQDEPAEVFAILCLTTKHRVIAYHEVSRGTLDTTLVHPREVFKLYLPMRQRSSSRITTQAATRRRAATTSP